MQLDLAIDALGHADTPDITLACLATLKRKGTLVLVGSVDCPVPIPYSE
jgi:alcohol dehydrogenase